MDYAPNWKPPSNSPYVHVGFMVLNMAIHLAEFVPELADLFPFRHNSNTRVWFGAGWVGIITDFTASLGAPPVIGKFQPNDVDVGVLERASNLTLSGTHTDLREALPSSYFSFMRFSYVGPYVEEKMSLLHLEVHLRGWIENMLAPEVLRRNKARVLRAIPPPPQINIEKISRALWILECEESAIQGTGFMLGGVGLVTCQHVVGSQTRAFRASAFQDKRRVSVSASEPAIDLALLDLEGEHDGELERESADGLKQMDHVIVCGYPNYRFGDTGTMVPGLVVGFRMMSGIRRILTNAPIVGGASGSPVVNASGRVIGVAATGADRMEAAQDTEHHSIIPIDALRFLRRPD
jgi:Trypsin-like peptidase domain